MEKSLSYISTNISKWGASGIAFCVAAFAVPPHYPLCVLSPLFQFSAVICGCMAAFRGSKRWLVLSAITTLLTAQAVVFVLVDC
jgi:hypothetical protein